METLPLAAASYDSDSDSDCVSDSYSDSECCTLNPTLSSLSHKTATMQAISLAFRMLCFHIVLILRILISNSCHCYGTWTMPLLGSVPGTWLVQLNWLPFTLSQQRVGLTTRSHLCSLHENRNSNMLSGLFSLKGAWLSIMAKP